MILKGKFAQGAVYEFSKIGDKGEGGVKNLKQWVTSFMDGPKGVVYYRLSRLIDQPF